MIRGPSKEGVARIFDPEQAARTPQRSCSERRAGACQWMSPIVGGPPAERDEPRFSHTSERRRGGLRAQAPTANLWKSFHVDNARNKPVNKQTS